MFYFSWGFNFISSDRGYKGRGVNKTMDDWSGIINKIKLEKKCIESSGLGDIFFIVVLSRIFHN